MRTRTRYPALLLLAALAPLQAAWAAGTVKPGETLHFQDPDYGTRSCVLNAAFRSCSIPTFVGTGWNLPQHRVRARVYQPAPSNLYPPSQAVGSLHNEFILGGTPRHLVNTRVSVDYRIVSAAVKVLLNAATEIAVELEVTDISDPSAPYPITSHEVYRLRREGEFTLPPTAATERQVELSGTGGFDVMLRTGRTYALSFSVETIADAFLGTNLSVGTAYWDALSITVDEDEVELLNDLAVVLERHDEDIKARLDRVDAKLERIERQLLTPQGRRPGWKGSD